VANPPFTSVRILGQAEVIAAFNEVEDFDKQAAARAAGEALIPYIAINTRAFSGLLQASYLMQDDYISNEQDYATVQEYGSIWVSPTHAIATAAEQHPEALELGYEETINDAARQAGFDT